MRRPPFTRREFLQGLAAASGASAGGLLMNADALARTIESGEA